ncbi:MAG: radical SAM/SPASM domain-containing protein [Pseudonocardiales bacterium]
MQDLRFVWLELTGRCSLSCAHCYADSGPKGTDGAMRPQDWLRVIDEVAQLGGRMVQFIGGEPTLHRSLPAFVDHALVGGLEVEVFSNLTHVSPQLWRVFTQPGVRLATSYYSDNATEHEAITKGRNSYARTKANIIEALRRSIPLRVGLIDVQDGQRVEQARAELEALGVTDIGFDLLRQVGRGVRDQQPNVDQLCGRCADSVVAISPDGSVWPCVFARWLPVGNIRESPLHEIIDGTILATTRTQLQHDFAKRQCGPDKHQCGPDKQKCAPESRCEPSQSDCKPHCPPGYHCGPKCVPDQCWPGYYCAPDG